MVDLFEDPDFAHLSPKTMQQAPAPSGNYQESPMMASVGKNLLSGLKELGVGGLQAYQNLVNAPHNLFKDLPGAGPKIASYIPHINVPKEALEQMVGLNPQEIGPLGRGMESVGQAIPALASLPGMGLGAAGAIGGVLGGSGHPLYEAPLGSAEALIGGQAIKSLLPKFGEALSSLKPKKLMENMKETLGKGRDLEQNRISAAEDLRNYNDFLQAKQNEIFRPVNEKHNKESIYPFNRNWASLDSRIKDSLSPDVRDMMKSFEEKATFDLAHKIQSQIGDEMRVIQANPKRTVADDHYLQNYKKARDAMNNDIDSYFANRDPEMGERYGMGRLFHFEKIAPLKADTKIWEIANGKIKNPEEIHRTFQSPEENTRNIVNQLGRDFKDKILFDYLGSAKNPARMAEKYENASENKLNFYKHQDLTNAFQKMLKSQERSEKYGNIAKKVAKWGALGGAAALGLGHIGRNVSHGGEE